MNCKHLGVMLDCSRNAVVRPDQVKKYIDILQRLGYNSLMLYTEDTYEVDNQPYFGYLRGRYSQAEMKEMDAYARDHGVELIPCIQTLAHVNAIVRWNAYKPIVDTDDILLCGAPGTYELLEDIFATLEKCFTSRTVHIGMDEAHMVGLGKYLNQHGYQNRFDILLKHLEKVCEIAKKHGFRPIMWSDMFFRLASGGDYYSYESFDKSVTDGVPEELGLVYWDYYYTDKAHYDGMIEAHQQFRNEIWFAGGLWTWAGFAPKNGFSIATLDAAAPSLREHQVENVFFTIWGDDTAECSHLAVLPSLYYAAKKMQGINDLEAIKAGFEKEFGIPYDAFMLLDLPDTTDDTPNTASNPEKYMFYNDPFAGVMDCTVPEGFEPRYLECARKLKQYADHEEYGYLFDTMAKLCEFLQLKFTIGVRTRKAYREGDRKALAALVEDYDRLLIRLENFYQAHKKRWFIDNKPHGFDVQDLRMGGLKQRIIHCTERLDQYLRGRIDRIEELEENILPEFPTKDVHRGQPYRDVSVNVLFH